MARLRYLPRVRSLGPPLLHALLHINSVDDRSWMAAVADDLVWLKDLLSNNKGEVNHIRRIVLACERDMEDFTAAMDAVNVDLDEMRARVF